VKSTLQSGVIGYADTSLPLPSSLANTLNGTSRLMGLIDPAASARHRTLAAGTRVAYAGALVLVVAAAGCRQSPAPTTSRTEPSPPPAAQQVAPAAQPPARRAEVSIEGLPKTVDDRMVLAVAPATSDGKLHYEVSIGPCVEKACPVLISLLEAGKVLDRTHAKWASTTREPAPDEIRLGWGVGDPAGPPEGTTAWKTGEEEAYLGTAVRVVVLSPQTNGLLIDQRAGFEHVKRHHELFAHGDRRLQRVWSAGEGAGPAWTSTAIAPAGDGREAVVFFEGFRYPTSDEPDTLKSTRLQWNDASHGMAPQPAEPSIEASVIRGFKTVAAARQAKTAQRECLGAYWVLPATSVGATPKDGFVLAMPALDHERAIASTRCAADKKPEVLHLRRN
jgi:hypothetical protein